MAIWWIRIGKVELIETPSQSPKHEKSLDGTTTLVAVDFRERLLRGSGHPCPRVRAKTVNNDRERIALKGLLSNVHHRGT